MTRLLLVVLIAAAVCVVSAGVGAADDGLVAEGDNTITVVAMDNTTIDTTTAALSATDKAYRYILPYAYGQERSGCGGFSSRIYGFALEDNMTIHVDTNRDGDVDYETILNSTGDSFSYVVNNNQRTFINSSGRLFLYYRNGGNDCGSYDDSSLAYAIYPLSIAKGNIFYAPTYGTAHIASVSGISNIYLNKVLISSDTATYSTTVTAGDKIEADSDIVVTIAYRGSYTTRTWAYQLLPVQRLGTEYFLPTTHIWETTADGVDYSVLNVVATQNNTNVSYDNNSDGLLDYVAILQEGQVESIPVKAGVHISSNKSVAIGFISESYEKDAWGSSYIHYSYAYSIPPVSLLQKNFIIPHGSYYNSQHRSGRKFFVGAVENDTVVSIDNNRNGTVDIVYYLNSSETLDLTVSDKAYLSSNRPIQVVRISAGGWYGSGIDATYEAINILGELSDIDTTPPTLTITSPAPDTTTHTTTITVTGTASDPSGIASVTVNGALASGAADWSAWSAEVALAVGENTLTVVATNTTGGSTTKTINVTYAPLLDGKVLSSSTNDGIENVTVTLVGTGRTNKTGANGYYSFSGVADGSYTLTASKPGYTFSPVDIVVSESTRASPIIGTIDTTVINAEITSTVMPSGAFNPGDPVEVTITVKNTGTIEHTFYVGYSVRDPEDTFWDAPYVPVTLSPDESTTETLRWTVQPRAPVGSYDVYTAAWATQHWSYLYDNLDRVNAYETFTVQPNPGSVPGWTFSSSEKYEVLVDGRRYTVVWTVNNSNDNISWMVYDDEGAVPDITTFQHAAKTATVVKMLGSDTTDEVESLRSMQNGMNKFTGWTALGKVALWFRNTGAYLLGKYMAMTASGGTSLTTQMPAGEALKVAGHVIAKDMSDQIINDLFEMAIPSFGESSTKTILEKYAVANVVCSASKLGTAADTLEAHDSGLWTYHEANDYYDSYKEGVIDGMTYMKLTYELQPGSDLASQVSSVCNEVVKGLTGGIIDLDKVTSEMLADAIDDLDAVKYSAITREKCNKDFAVTDARFGSNAFDLWNAYHTAERVGGTLMCPGNLHAYDSEGRHVGVNLTGGIDLEIPNSYYSGPDAEPEIIRIYTPQDDNITFYVDNATTTGTFNLTLERQMNMTLESVWYLEISINETTVVSVSTNNSSNPDYLMEIDGDGTTDNVTEPTHILINHAPSISITTPAGVQIGNIPLLYNLTDAESDNCTIMAQYSLDNATWLDASVGEAGCGVINLTSTPAGVNHTFVWASGTDIPDTNATVYFRIRPYDGGMAGDYATTNAFPVDNRVRGDLNSDGILTPADAAIALRIAAGSRPCDDVMLAAADISGDDR
ncbi:MAG: carboxypeptidase regulatory-like domain-containing protein, partial [Candidatus Thermoplasmatota archaeon]|nr:carboxypeptidase regulatory-like domain-containing protein [Candidatus Thermoplasmatota archaeon]